MSAFIKPRVKYHRRYKLNVFSKAEALTVAKQYSRALLDIAKSTDNLKTIYSDIDSLGSVMKENVGFGDMMVNPLISSEEKRALITKISKEASFNVSTTHFLSLLIDKGRIDCIAEVIESYKDLYYEATGTQVAVVKSAVALEEEQHFLIAKKIQELTRSKMVTVKRVVDEALIGGFIVEYGSSKIDLSVRGALERIKKGLKGISS
eukprot:gnl/TRDRNA2_/TRDRNA2_163205_c0_seq1.p1 gnl/TRDRNA2_/TRDRNA2_163205_c0~~gnl/TRDRNA2_/TRDRNA2_163205_c0_seq1.p1  ORF type:complete len:206 (+),score=7.65 gnl/TRDRNA2_/TRDRNA2_163205_c0_seq1:24-641(+)